MLNCGPSFDNLLYVWLGFTLQKLQRTAKLEAYQQDSGIQPNGQKDMMLL